jgi:hypothetical protein
MFTDIINGNYFIDGAGGGERGISRNPIDSPFAVHGATAGGFVVQNGVPIFGGFTPVGPFQAFGVSQDIRSPYTQNFNLNVQHQLSRAVFVQVGYVGSQSRKQVTKRDLNQPLPDPTGLVTNSQLRRPIDLPEHLRHHMDGDQVPQYNCCKLYCTAVGMALPPGILRAGSRP